MIDWNSVLLIVFKLILILCSLVLYNFCLCFFNNKLFVVKLIFLILLIWFNLVISIFKFCCINGFLFVMCIFFIFNFVYILVILVILLNVKSLFLGKNMKLFLNIFLGM